MKFAFYGTLREGQGNRAWCDEHVKSLGVTTLSGYAMWSLGGYPYVMETPSEPENTITVELVEIDDPDTIMNIHGMEIGAGYYNDMIEVNDDIFIIYLFSEHGQHFSQTISSGDWNEFVKLKDAL
jgi:gamma-glutamylcyclotransferase (GGCT)/AIG2-like uncharacterized protein YtfP